MDELDDALKAILDHPRDDARRLAYASLLEARNDPLGEFIRLECRLADSSCQGDEALGLWDRRLALLEAHGASWFAPLEEIAVIPLLRLRLTSLLRDEEAYHLERGLVEGVILDLDAYLEHGAELFGRFPIRSLTISGTNGRVGELLASPWVDRIEYLTLHELDYPNSDKEGLSDDDVEELAGDDRLRSLRGINLGGNRNLGPRSVASILASPWCDQLERLDLSGTAVGDEGAERIASTDRLDGLRRLDVSYCGMGPAGAHALADSPTLARLGLVELDLSWNHHIGPAEYARLLCSPVMARVAGVDLGGRIDDELVDAILRSDCLRSVKALAGVAVGPIDSGALRRLARWPGLARLDRLMFANSKLTDEQLEILAMSPWLGNLKALCLSETYVTDDGVERLCRSPAWRGLEELGIDRNDLTGRSVQAILAATWFPRLTMLDLHSSGGVGDAGAAALASYQGPTRLRRLILSLAGLRDAGALALAGARFAPQLWTLWLRGNDISPSVGDLLRRRLGGRVKIEVTDGPEPWRMQPESTF